MKSQILHLAQPVGVCSLLSQPDAGSTSGLLHSAEEVEVGQSMAAGCDVSTLADVTEQKHSNASHNTKGPGDAPPGGLHV